MGVKITVKAVFSSTKEGWESFGNNRYILKISSPEDGDARSLIKAYISREMGVPPSKVAFLGRDPRNNWLFEVL